MEQKIGKTNSGTQVQYNDTIIKTLILPPETEIKNIQLKLPKKVHWTEDTIDNENMQKKKSKST
jgi:hypothetical protein